jgi:hypothetical protein
MRSHRQSPERLFYRVLPDNRPLIGTITGHVKFGAPVAVTTFPKSSDLFSADYAPSVRKLVVRRVLISRISQRSCCCDMNMLWPCPALKCPSSVDDWRK